MVIDTYVLASIRPIWCEKIFDGSKTLELRKTAPKETPFRVYVYCTQGSQYEALVVGDTGAALIPCFNWKTSIPVGGEIGNGMVIGEFICDKTTTLYYDSDVRYGMDFLNDYAKRIMHATCLTLHEMADYLNGKDGVMWHITNPKLYDKPRPLTNYHRPCINSLYCESCAMHNEHPVPYCGNYALEIRRPPQSWMYAEDQT